MSVAPILFTPQAPFMTPPTHCCLEQSSTGKEQLSEHYELLSHLAMTLAACRPADIAGHLAIALHQFVHFDCLDIVAFKEGTSEVLWHSKGAGQFTPLDLPIEQTMTWWVFENQQPLCISDWTHDERFKERREALRERGVNYRSLFRLPLSTPNRRIGVLRVASLRPHSLSNSEIHLLSLLAGQVAASIASAMSVDASRRVEAELEVKTARLKLIRELTDAVVAAPEFRDVLATVAVSAREVMQSDLALVALLDADSGRFRLEALDVPEQCPIFDEATRYALAEKFARFVLSSGEPWVGSSEIPQEISCRSDSNFGDCLRQACIVPLTMRGEVFGIFALARGQANPYSEDELDFLSQVAKHLTVATENAVMNEELQKMRDDFAEEKVHLEDEIQSEMNFEEIVGRSAALQRVLREVEIVAPTGSGVLILGETGTGKELIAKAIHNRSDRRHQAFVKVNCAAIPSGLLESELFGHEKGAFTGAIMRKAGRFEVADKGTLFLDEVGDIPLDLQPKLLRVLQEREFERLGSTRTQQVDVRVIAATHRDLKKMVEDGQFRSDLFYRLQVFPLSVPPLRDRSDDIPILVRYYVDKYARQLSRRIETIPPQAMQVFCNYPWPGNVRELQNFIERAVILSPGPSLRAPLAELKQDAMQASQSKLGTLEQIEREHVLRAVRESNWVIGGPNGAAARLGMKRTTLAYRIRKLKIPCRPQ